MAEETRPWRTRATAAVARLLPSGRARRVEAAQTWCEVAGVGALVAAGFTLSVTVGLVVLGVGLLVAGNVRIGG